MYGVVVTKQFTRSIRNLTKGRKGPATYWHPGEVIVPFADPPFGHTGKVITESCPRPPILRRVIRMSPFCPPREPDRTLGEIPSDGCFPLVLSRVVVNGAHARLPRPGAARRQRG